MIVLVGLVGTIVMRGFFAAMDMFSPFNLANTFMVLLVLAPGGLLLYAAGKLKIQKPAGITSCASAPVPWTRKVAGDIAADYGIVLEQAWSWPMSESRLPHPRERILGALRYLLTTEKDRDT